MARAPKPTGRDMENLHERVAVCMAGAGQRYTTGRKAIIEILASTTQPLDMAAIAQQLPDVPQSSAYRSLSVFTSLGVTTRVSGKDDSGYFEISEDFEGQHHHHAICQECGRVSDIESSPKLERALQEATRAAGEQSGFRFDAHRIDLVGVCKDCQ